MLSLLEPFCITFKLSSLNSSANHSIWIVPIFHDINCKFAAHVVTHYSQSAKDIFLYFKPQSDLEDPSPSWYLFP